MNETKHTRVLTPENLITGETYLLRTKQGNWCEGTFVDLYGKRGRLRVLFEDVRLMDGQGGYMRTMAVFWPVECWEFSEIT